MSCFAKIMLKQLSSQHNFICIIQIFHLFLRQEEKMIQL